MLASLQAFLHARPRLFDLARRLDWRRDPARQYLRRYSAAEGSGCTFLQVGANDGLVNDPVREFVVRDGWRGVLVEPVPSVFERLKSNYRRVEPGRLVFVNAAVTGSGEGPLPFWTYSDEFLGGLTEERRLFFLRKSSFDREHPLRFLRREGLSDSGLRRILVPSMTLTALVERHWRGAPIGLLVIDAEGHEAAILRGHDFAAWRPRAIFFESHNLGVDRAPLLDRLREEGYGVTTVGGDTVAELPT